MPKIRTGPSVRWDTLPPPCAEKKGGSGHRDPAAGHVLPRYRLPGPQSVPCARSHPAAGHHTVLRCALWVLQRQPWSPLRCCRERYGNSPHTKWCAARTRLAHQAPTGPPPPPQHAWLGRWHRFQALFPCPLHSAAPAGAGSGSRQASAYPNAPFSCTAIRNHFLPYELYPIRRVLTRMKVSANSKRLLPRQQEPF